MIPAKNFSYKEVDGDHWPDANLGDALYYSIDYSQWVVNESDSLISVEWEVPTGLLGSDAHEGSGQAFIKLTTQQYGSFKVICSITTEENGKQQVKTKSMILRVI